MKEVRWEVDQESRPVVNACSQDKVIGGSVCESNAPATGKPAARRF